MKKLILSEYIQSLDSSSIPNEAIALNYAVAAGIVEDFLQDEELVPTVSGRMSSGIFDFNIYNKKIILMTKYGWTIHKLRLMRPTRESVD